MTEDLTRRDVVRGATASALMALAPNAVVAALPIPAVDDERIARIHSLRAHRQASVTKLFDSELTSFC